MVPVPAVRADRVDGLEDHVGARRAVDRLRLVGRGAGHVAQLARQPVDAAARAVHRVVAALDVAVGRLAGREQRQRGAQDDEEQRHRHQEADERELAALVAEAHGMSSPGGLGRLGVVVVDGRHVVGVALGRRGVGERGRARRQQGAVAVGQRRAVAVDAVALDRAVGVARRGQPADRRSTRPTARRPVSAPTGRAGRRVAEVDRDLRRVRACADAVGLAVAVVGDDVVVPVAAAGEARVGARQRAAHRAHRVGRAGALHAEELVALDVALAVGVPDRLDAGAADAGHRGVGGLVGRAAVERDRRGLGRAGLPVVVDGLGAEHGACRRAPRWRSASCRRSRTPRCPATR